MNDPSLPGTRETVSSYSLILVPCSCLCPQQGEEKDQRKQMSTWLSLGGVAQCRQPFLCKHYSTSSVSARLLSDRHGLERAWKHVLIFINTKGPGPIQLSELMMMWGCLSCIYCAGWWFILGWGSLKDKPSAAIFMDKLNWLKVNLSTASTISTVTEEIVLNGILMIFGLRQISEYGQIVWCQLRKRGVYMTYRNSLHVMIKKEIPFLFSSWNNNWVFLKEGEGSLWAKKKRLQGSSHLSMHKFVDHVTLNCRHFHETYRIEPAPERISHRKRDLIRGIEGIKEGPWGQMGKTGRESESPLFRLLSFNKE